MIQMIPLKKLAVSPHNVRKHDVMFDLSGLAASILARGLLQNLIGTAAKKKGHFDITAGGRRLRALGLLLANGDIADTFEVPVVVLEGSGADHAETSLAENFHRLAMTPADECTAFKHFLGELGDIDAVAIRFGVTRRHIEGRLRLANLAEPIFAALGEGKITLDIAKAYGATSDTAKQLAVFEQLGNSWQADNAGTIRNAILHQAIKAGDALARFVGLANYEAAGGRFDSQLFDDVDAVRWIDPEIATALAEARLAVIAETTRAELGLGWVTPILAPRVTWDETSSLYEVSGEQPELSDAELARIEVIETEQSEIGETLNEGDDENSEILSACYEALDQELSALENRPSVIAEALRGQVGQFMILSGAGEPLLDNRYFSREPIEGIHNQPTTRSSPETTASIVAKTEGLSAKLIDELAMQRRDLLSVHVASDPSLALDLTIFLLAERASGTHSLGSAKSTLEARRPNDPVFGDKVPATNAKIHLGDIGEALDRSWCEFDSVAARFDAFRAIDDSSRAAWLSYCVAKSLEASTGVVGAAHYSGFHNHIGTMLEIDTATWWRPTAANYFARVRKQQLLKVLEEIGGPTLSSRYSAAKQSELAVACEMLCAGTAQVEPEVRARALAWVPNVMRFDCTVEDAEGEQDRDEIDDAADAANDLNEDAVSGDGEDAVTNELAEQDADADEPANA
jgi:ParB family transcriptional regulator, chromosome partitioning protein